MFWVWQTGHKFMRLELATNNEQWLFHLGSTGCKSASVMRVPEQAIANNSIGRLALNVNLAEMLNNVELTSLSSCQSEQNKLSCQQLFNNLSPVKKINNTPAVSSVFRAINIKPENTGEDVE